MNATIASVLFDRQQTVQPQSGIKPMSANNLPFVSVIIPVYNQSAQLRTCLAALAQQTYERSRFEVIVIDNASDDAEAIAAIVTGYDNVMLTSESAPGSYAARNHGLTLAQGELLAFTDADCIPADDWLAEGVQQLSQYPNGGQVVGHIELFFADPKRPTPVELFEQITAFPQERLLKQLHGGATANLFTWRKVIDEVGPFDPHLKSNGDLEWGQRVHTHGYPQIYAASVRVRHPARASWAELSVRTRRLAGGQYERQLKSAATPWQCQQVFLRNLLFYLMPPVFFTVNAFRDRRLQSFQQKFWVAWVMVVVRGISAWEMVRLKSGALSTRS